MGSDTVSSTIQAPLTVTIYYGYSSITHTYNYWQCPLLSFDCVVDVSGSGCCCQDKAVTGRYAPRRLTWSQMYPLHLLLPPSLPFLFLLIFFVSSHSTFSQQNSSFSNVCASKRNPSSYHLFLLFWFRPLGVADIVVVVVSNGGSLGGWWFLLFEYYYDYHERCFDDENVVAVDDGGS